ncbi:hypothetical protein O181_001366 [Austropuccinia psidii MF-1]|uniref:Uncharacterized protein n=1 Tax=Austropuccinia psidii MF-1 TaxID=1389203 RepID=A0A9Q3GCC2_9BASI|nr:hypothetical protein [Austropuccinia psidii MF-1]
MNKIVKTLQEGHAKLSKASEENNELLNQVFEEQHHCKMDKECLDQDIKELFNVCHNMRSILDDPYHQEDIKSDASLVNMARSPSQYQDGENMSYSEKEDLKQLPEAPNVPSIPDYWITARLNTEFKGHASLWYIEMRELCGRRSWPWWKSQIIQNESNGTCIWKKTMSFENDKDSRDKDPYEWCLGQSKRLKAIGPQMNIQMGNHKPLTQMAGELENAVKCRLKQSFTLDDILNTLKYVRKRTNIGIYCRFWSSIFKEKQNFRVDFKAKCREKMAEVTKKKNTCHNCCSTDHYAINCLKAKKKFYAIEEVPEEESPTEDSETDSMGNAITEHSDHDHDSREEFLVEYQEETKMEIQDIQLEEGMPQDIAYKNLCKHKYKMQKHS